MSIQKQQAEIEEQRAKEPLERNELYNDMVGSYLQSIDNLKKVEAEFGADAQLIAARNMAQKQLRAALTVPLNVAAAGQQMNRQGAGAIARSSTETANMLLEESGIGNKDTQDRVSRTMLKNAALSHGVKIPEMSVSQQSFNITGQFYEEDLDPASLSGVTVADTPKLKGNMSRLLDSANTNFERLAQRPNITPEERMTYALSAAVGQTEIASEHSPAETFYMVNSVMETLTRRQLVRVQRGLAQLPALNRKYEEAAGAVMLDFMADSKAAGRELTYNNLLDNVGQNEALRALRDPEGISHSYQQIKNNIAELHKNYEKASEGERFRMFVDAYADYAVANVNTGSPIRDQYQIGGLDRLQQANAAGLLDSTFSGLVAPLQDLWRDFDSQHNAVTVERNGIIDRNRQNGLISGIAPDGKVVAWKPINEPLRNERVADLLTDPAVWDLMNDMNKLTADKDGNWILNAGDVDVLALNTYRAAMNTGGDFTKIVVQEQTATTGPVTMNEFSFEGKQRWSETLANFSGQLLGNYKFFKDVKEGEVRNWGAKIEKFKLGDIPYGKVIMRSPELQMALRTADGNPNQIQAVANAALAIHFAAVDNSVMRVDNQAEFDIIRNVAQAVPVELRETVQEELGKYGRVDTLASQIPVLKANVDAAKQELNNYLASIAITAPIILEADASFMAKKDLATGAFEEYQRQRDNIRREKAKARTVAGYVENYVRQIEKQGEVEELQKQLGLVPPRAWAFLSNMNKLTEQLELIYKDPDLSESQGVIESIQQAEQ
jgi:hypothetical protein